MVSAWSAPLSVSSYSTRGGNITRLASFIEMMLLPDLGMNEGLFTFFMHPRQAMQMIALEDLGRINAEILCHPERYAGQSLELSVQAITDDGLEKAFPHAAGRPIRYQRFPEQLLATNWPLCTAVFIHL